LPLEIVTEWGFGAVVVSIVFDVDDKEGIVFDELLVIDERIFLLALS
jgi:hypothetical protein